jgi:hypothetical protein
VGLPGLSIGVGLAMVTEGEKPEACENWMNERMSSLKDYRPMEARGEVICEVNGPREARVPMR